MGETFGDIVFSLVIGYLSAIEFLYVVRHLYHYSFNHDANDGVDDGENVSQLQDSLRQQLAIATNKEAAAGTQVMKDGVPYRDGFRLEAQQALIDQLKEQLKDKELSDMRRKELEKELAEQTKIANKLRKELAEAEAKYQRQLRQEEEAKTKIVLEEQKQREAAERAEQEAVEQARRLVEAEKQREAEQRKQEEEEEEERSRKEAEENERKQHEQQQRKEAEEQAKREAEEQALRFVELEKQREAEQRKREEEEERDRIEAEHKEKEQKQLEEQERKAAEEQDHRLVEAEKQREIEQRQYEEAEENDRKLQEAEKRRENEQRKLEEEQDTEKQRQAEREREDQEIAEDEENTQRLLAIEKANEEAVEAAEAELAATSLLAIEHRLEEQLRAAEREAELTEKERQLIDSIKESDLSEEEGNEHKEAELLRKILEAREQLGSESEEEQTLRLIQRERDQEAKQKRIEENALLFMEAENEMAELQSKKKEFSGYLDSAPQTPVVEEPCIKRNFYPLSSGESSHSTVKTQLAQDLDDPYSVRTKVLLFPGVSDDASSVDPASSQKSSFSTQPSEEITTGTDSQYVPLERQEPDGEDTALTNMQYSDEYLRSLDGIKQRPLLREDGSGRRRAFKKRRSSNSSNSSRESRHSRDEELKMFTSLEEEEMKDNGDSEFTPIRYTTEPTLKVKSHHRRHKRSPAKDMKRSDSDHLRSSLERLGEESGDPWGEVKPEHYKNTEFWKREKASSIDEELEFEKPASSEKVVYDTALNMPSASSFEEATQKQNQEALTSLRKNSAQRDAQEGTTDEPTEPKEETVGSDNTNLQTSQIASTSPRLRRTPLIDETHQHQEHLKDESTSQNTPTINVEAPLDVAPWRDEYGLVMQGLSDFYDFSASINRSRSRPTSPAPDTPLPKDVSFQLKTSNENMNQKATIEIYDDTGSVTDNELKLENIIKFIDNLKDNEEGGIDEQNHQHNIVFETEVGIKKHLQNVADDHDPSQALSNQASLVTLVNIIDDINVQNFGDSSDAARNTSSVTSSGSQKANGSRSRSRSNSPLPTPDNLKRSVENRRYKMIKHNEDILEKLIESKLLPELTTSEDIEEKSSTEKTQTTKWNVVSDDHENINQGQINYLVSSLRCETRRSRSKSPMCLPTVENLSKGLEKRRCKLIERNDEFIKQLEERSQTPESPMIVVQHVYEIESTQETQSTVALSTPTDEEDDCSKENMDLLVQSLRVARSKTKSKSPMPLKEIENMSETSESERFYEFQHTEHVEIVQQLENRNLPTISIEFSEAETESTTSAKVGDDDECSRENMNLLIQSLRGARSKSTSKSPMRLPTDKLMHHIEDRAKTPEPFVCEFEKAVETDTEGQRSRYSRSKSPSRSHSKSPATAAAYRSNTPSRSLSPRPDRYDDFHVMLNLEGSMNRTLLVSSEEQESLLLSNRERQLDEEALEKLRNASDETELRTLSPLILDAEEINEQQNQDYLTELPLTERNKLLRKSPTTPDYDRTISEEMRDVERIKQERLAKGFKRSTYVGESMDLGREFETLRREAAKFQRSRSPSPSFSTIESATAQRNAEENRKIQDLILHELTATTSKTETKESRNTGAIPKAERFSSCEIELSLNNELEDIEHIKEEILNSSFQRPTETFEEMRRRNAEFRRSASTSRSPLREAQLEEVASIESEAAKRGHRNKFSNEVTCHSPNLQDFSQNLNADFFDNDRRASDSALIKVPKSLVQHGEDIELEPEEYHHYRRFSLAQEEPVEQYPGDDYIFIQQVEVRTRSGSRTWVREDFYSENVDDYLAKSEKSPENAVERENLDPVGSEEQSSRDHQLEENIPGADDDEEYSNASDDDRQTVVEIDDEIDEDISDFNERGPAEESHHEISECEEAEREMDRYADREASDWNQAVAVDAILIPENRANEVTAIGEDEGAVGGLSNSPHDSDSFAIDQIYDDAIKNRKQSGILREYDSILVQMCMNSDDDEQQPFVGSRNSGKKNPKNVEFNTQFLHNEYKDSEMRYLGDANIMARQSTRLRSRYGYNPALQTPCIEDDLEVDMNYKPKREYNWRKNFRLDEDIIKEDKEITLNEICFEEETKEEREQIMDERKISFGGESVTLFSEFDVNLVNETINKEEFNKEEKLEKSKKRKTKKKSHKESKARLEETMNKEDEDEDANNNNKIYSRRNSSIQIDTDSPKRKSHSRRNSKSSLANENSLVLISPSRNSVAYNETIAEIMEVAKETVRPKKMKKRKKAKELMANVAESPIENNENVEYIIERQNDIPAVSAVVTPESSSTNILSTLSPQNSVCVTPASTDTDVNLSVEDLREGNTETTSNSSSTTTTTTTTGSPSDEIVSRTSPITPTTPVVDAFDILKDANFYPLF